MRQRPRPRPFASARSARAKPRRLAVAALGRPWRKWETWLAILALFLVSGGLLPWGPLERIVCAALAFTIILVLLGVRFAGAVHGDNGGA